MDTLIKRIIEHYEAREFPRSALLFLEATLRRSIRGDRLEIATDLLKFTKSIATLAPDQFPVPALPPRTRSRLEAVQAVFSFAFGYRLKSRSAPGEERRLPGLNNRALAEISKHLKLSLNVPLFAQFEIADALADYADVTAEYSTPAADLGTSKVIESFKSQAESLFQGLRHVVVVAHQHHVARCVLLLWDDFNIEALPSVEVYRGYDPRETQHRVVSPEEFILSDFVSMAAHRPWKQLPWV